LGTKKVEQKSLKFKIDNAVVIPKLETNTIKHYCRDVALQRLYKGKYCRF